MATSTYFFKAKPFGEPYKLVIVVAEEEKAIGSGSALAKTLKLKDLRAADDALVSEVLSKSKTEATVLDVTPNNAPGVLVVVSATLQDARLKEHLAASQVKVQELTFGEKGAAPYALLALAKWTEF
jgi:hypothetical protein